MKRLFTVFASLILCSVCLMAQKTYIDNEGVKSNMNQKIDFKPNSFHIDLGISTSFEAGFHIQHNFNPYISWDIVNTRYSVEFLSSYCLQQVVAMTGIRAFTPAFGKYKQMKVYLAVDCGYGGGENVKDYTYKSIVWKNALVLGMELGIYLSRHFYLAASSIMPVYPGFGISVPVLRIGYEF